MITIPLYLLDDSPFQTRRDYDPAALQELAADIKQNTLIHPIVVREQAGRFQTAVGHRRARAYALLAKDDPAYSSIPADVRELSDEEMATLAISENLKRKDVTPIEEAQAIQGMIDRFGWTQEQVAKKLGLSRPTVANKLRLLGAPEPVKEALATGKISERQASALLPLADLPQSIVDAAEKSPDYQRSHRPSEILKNAPTMSSDQIRDRIASLVEENTFPLGQADNCPLDYAIDNPHVHAARCDACPDRIKGRCPDKSCLNRKTKIWSAQLLAAATAATGIQPATSEPKYGEIEDFTVHQELLPQILQDGCPNLRLVFGGWRGRLLTGHPQVRVFCIHEQDKVCKCIDRITGRDREAAAAAKAAEHQRVVDELLSPARGAIQDALLSGQAPAGLWLAVYKLFTYNNVTSGLADASAKRVVRAIAEQIVEKAMGYGSAEDFRAARTDLDALFEACKVASPWSTPADEKILRKLDRIQGWLKDSATRIPEPAAVAGNMDNVRALLDELEASGLSGEPFADLQLRLHSTLQILGELSLELQEKAPDERGLKLYAVLHYNWPDWHDASRWELNWALNFVSLVMPQDSQESQRNLIVKRLAELAAEEQRQRQAAAQARPSLPSGEGVLAVVCPTCGAKAGEACPGRDKPHVGRVANALQAGYVRTAEPYTLGEVFAPQADVPGRDERVDVMGAIEDALAADDKEFPTL